MISNSTQNYSTQTFQDASFGKETSEFNPEDGNLYYFGDSFNDPGQIHHVNEDLFLDELNIELESKDGSRKETIHVRGKNGCACNGKIQADFVAEKLKMETHHGFAIDGLPDKSGHMVNFSLSGAAQTNSSAIFFSEDKPKPSLGVAYQIKKLGKLLLEGKSKLNERDICVIQVTFNDIFLVYQAAQKQQGNWGKYFTPEELEKKYVTTAVDNVNKLYDLGCRKVILSIFSNLAALKTLNWKKLDKVNPGVLADMDKRLARMQNALKTQISENSKERWNDLRIEILDATKWWVEVQSEMDTSTTLTDSGWTADAEKGKENNLFFFDDTHPSAEAHEKMAEKFIEVIK